MTFDSIDNIDFAGGNGGSYDLAAITGNQALDIGNLGLSSANASPVDTLSPAATEIIGNGQVNGIA